MSDPEDDDRPILARAVPAATYLRQLAARPQKRPLGSHSGAFLRRLELIDDEVIIEIGGKATRTTAAVAQQELGERWYLSSQFTGRERVTQKGREELAKLKRQS